MSGNAHLRFLGGKAAAMPPTYPINRVTPVIDLISYRYNRMLFTMVTTNLTPAQIRATYGDRIADRFNEMMLILPYKNPSFRTPQPNASLLQ